MLVRRRKKRKKRRIIIIILLIILITSIALFILKPKNKQEIKLEKNEIEINSEVYLYDLIKNNEIQLVTENNQIDTSTLGIQEIILEYKENNKIISKKVNINIIDTTKPIIEGNDKIELNIGSTENILDNYTVTDNSKENIKIEIKGEYDLNKEGEYSLTLIAKDSSNNTEEKNIVLVINDNNKNNQSNTNNKTKKGYEIVTKNEITYIDGNIIVNKTYSLPSDYKPENPYSGSVDSDWCLNCIDKDTYKALENMISDAKSIGLNIYMSSGYRSYSYQSTLYNNYVSYDGKQAADKYSARPGHSEHQTGLCFDLNTVDDSFANTEEGKWVNNNAYLYGLIIRYPKGKEQETGYQYESWHLRYVGKELAKKLYNNGDWITLEEYYGITSEYSE